MHKSEKATESGRNGPLRFGLVLGAVALLVVTGIILQRGSLEVGAGDNESEVNEAIDRGEAVAGHVAATVNGREIPESRVQMMLALGSTFGLPDGVSDRSSAIDLLVKLDLLYHEAVSQGLTPEESELDAFVRSQIEAVRVAAENDEQIAAVLGGWERMGHPIDGWADDPVIRDVYRRMMSVGNLTAEFRQQYDQNDPEAAANAAADVEALATELRAEADIEVHPAPDLTPSQ